MTQETALTTQESNVAVIENRFNIATYDILNTYAKWNTFYAYQEAENLESGNTVTKIGQMCLWTKKVDGVPHVMVAQLDTASKINGRYVTMLLPVDDIDESHVVLWKFRQERQFDTVSDHAGIAHHRTVENDNAVNSYLYTLFGIYGKATRDNFQTKLLCLQGMSNSENELVLQQVAAPVAQNKTYRNVQDVTFSSELANQVKGFHRELTEYVGFGTASSWKAPHLRSANNSTQEALKSGDVVQSTATPVVKVFEITTNRNRYEIAIAPAKAHLIEVDVKDYNNKNINLTELRRKVKKVGGEVVKVS